MSHEAHFLIPPTEARIQAIIDQAAQAPPCAEAVQMPPSPEQVQATEAVFAHDDAEHQQVAALLGLWTSALVLHDVAVETFDPPADEKEDPDSKKNKDRPDELV